MSEENFWQATPKKLKAMLSVHIQINSPGADKEEPSTQYIDQVIF